MKTAQFDPPGPLLPVAAALFLLWLPAPALAGQVARPATPASSAVTPAMSNCPSGMTKVTDGQFRVFACDDGPAAAADEQAALTDLQDLYLPETGLMGPPLPDFQVPHENGRIDVYLVTSNQTLTREGDTINLQTDPGCPCNGQAPWDAINGTVSSGYIVALRPESLPAGNSFNSVLAHEFFHVLQYSHNTTLSCPGFWFTEASATWAEWWFAPTTAGMMVYPWFTHFQAKPDVSLTDSGNRKPYTDWMWPLFMQQQAGVASIANAWKAMGGKTGCDALNAAINLQVPFNPYFGDFAVENFDYQLANLATNVKAWPVNFGANYPDFRTAANPSAPAFPEEKPKHDNVTPGQSSYPYTATVPVNLPPLSAKYTKVSLVPPPAGGLGDGGSVELDFSGLSPSGYLWVSLLGADKQASGYTTNNGVWERVDLTGGDTHAKICLSADGTKKNHPLTGQFYVIVANRSSGASAAPITGSYTITQRSTCAAELTGALTINTTQTFGPDTIQKSANLNLDLTSIQGGFWYAAPSTNTWSEKYTESYPCDKGGTETTNASGSGAIKQNGDFFNGLDNNLYLEPYSFTPTLPGELLGGETAQGTESGLCGSGQVTVYLFIGQGCPAPHFGGGGSPDPFRGAHTSGNAGVDLTCSGTFTDPVTGDTYTVTISGTLTAADPIQCGLWTKSCPIGSQAITRGRPSKSLNR